jgi:multidrug efflux system membrane fusion protein
VSKAVVTVPVAAVQHGPDGLFVYKMADNNTVTVQPIKTVRQAGDVYVVATGLTEGNVVVVTGQSRLQNGAKVAIVDTKTSQPLRTGS